MLHAFRWLIAFTLRGPVFGIVQDGPDPDPNVGRAARDQAAIGREQLAFSREQYADQKAYMDQLQPFIDHYLASNMEQLDLTNEQNRQAFEDYQNLYRPNELKYMEDVAAAGSQEKQDAAAAAAGAGIQQQIDLQRQITARDNASMGIAPESGRSQSTGRVSEILAATARAGAENAARVAEEQRGVSARAGAVGVGRGQAQLALGGVQVGNQTTGAGIGAGVTPFNMNQQAGGQFISGLDAAGTSITRGGQLSLNAWEAQQKAQQQQSAGLGGLFSLGAKAAGAGMGSGGLAAALSILSDEELKTDKKPVSGRQLQKAVKGMRVERWKYADGVVDDGGQEYVGTYAQDFAKTTGVGDGHTIPVASAIGVLQGALKQTINDVENLARLVAREGVAA